MLSRLLAALFVLALAVVPRAHAYAAGTRPTPAQIADLNLESLPAAPGGGLMTAAPAEGGAEAAAAVTPGILRARAATISPDYLNALVAGEELQVDAKGAVVGAPPAFLLNLFDELSVRAVKLEMSRDGLGNLIWRGTLVGGGDALLVIDRQSVTAEIRIGAKVIRIQPVQGDVHRIVEVDPAARPRGGNDAVKPEMPSANPSIGTPKKNLEKSSATNPATVKVLFVYTAKARTEVASINSSISLAVAYTNTALSNSQTNAQISLVGTAQVNYPELSKKMSDVLDDLRAGTGDLERVQRLRAAFGADLVEIWIGKNADSGLCGLAYVLDDSDTPGLNLASTASFGFSVITTDFNGDCLTDSVAHELGHNFGAKHDRFVETDAVAGPTAYNYGYVDVPNRFKDIMAYDDACTKQSVNCTMVQYYSNPNLTYQGQPLGIADSQADAADDARRIGEIAPYLAQLHNHLSAAQALVRLGHVSSTLQTASGSFLRFHNTGANAGVATVTLEDPNGQLLGTWTSPSVPAGGESQFSLTTIENGITPVFTKPSYYSAGIRTNFNGYTQHVLYRPADGTLTNLSTCSAGVTADPKKVSGVHTSILGAINFPSSIVINNTGTTAATASLGIYDSNTGLKRGTYVSPSIPADGEAVVTIAAMESAIAQAPASNMYHYVIQVENTFTGFLQHLVNNVQAGVVTDMTTVCALEGFASLTTSSPLKGGAVFSTAQSASQSYLRFHNTGTAAGTVTATVRDYLTGQSYGQWVSSSIPADAELQFSIGTVEGSLTLPTTKPAYYSVNIQSGITGYYEHVLFRPTDGTLTNLSTCGAGVTADPAKLSGVHTGTLGAFNFPSSIVVTNTGTSAAAVMLGIFDARNGTRIGGYTTSTAIAPKGHTTLTVQQIEIGLGHTPASNEYHYTVKVEGGFTGFLQHLVNNVQAGVITDMTTGCILP